MVQHQTNIGPLSVFARNEMKTSIAPTSSEGRAQRRNPSLSNSKEESREISMVVIREPGRRGARAEKPDQRNAF